MTIVAAQVRRISRGGDQKAVSKGRVSKANTMMISKERLTPQTSLRAYQRCCRAWFTAPTGGAESMRNQPGGDSESYRWSVPVAYHLRPYRRSHDDGHAAMLVSDRRNVDGPWY